MNKPTEPVVCTITITETPLAEGGSLEILSKIPADQDCLATTVAIAGDKLLKLLAEHIIKQHAESLETRDETSVVLVPRGVVRH